MACQVFAHTDALAAELVRRTIEAANEAVAVRGQFTLALTGGSAATSLYPVLAQAPLPWHAIHVFFGDERCVPPEATESNFRLARELLLARVPLPVGNIHRVAGERPPHDAAADAERELLAVCDGTLDVVHVGVGPDGHVCSLFADHPLLEERQRLVAALTDAPKPPATRVTLTLPALARARALLFLVLGEAKAEAVRDAIFDGSSRAPAALAARAGQRVDWLVDADAARLIRNG